MIISKFGDDFINNSLMYKDLNQPWPVIIFNFWYWTVLWWIYARAPFVIFFPFSQKTTVYTEKQTKKQNYWQKGRLNDHGAGVDILLICLIVFHIPIFSHNILSHGVISLFQAPQNYGVRSFWMLRISLWMCGWISHPKTKL